MKLLRCSREMAETRNSDLVNEVNCQCQVLVSSTFLFAVCATDVVKQLLKIKALQAAFALIGTEFLYVT